MGTNIVSADDYVKKVFTEQEQEILRENHYVRSVTSNRLIFTYEFRIILYEAWEKRKSASAIQKVLKEYGFDLEMLGKKLIQHLSDHFKSNGRPKYSQHETRAKRRTEKEIADSILLSTGNFVKQGCGIWFSKELIAKLWSSFPEQSIEGGLRKAGIDPEIVGYYRIYQLERQFRSPEYNSERKRINYSEETIQIFRKHPYIKNITKSQMRFRNEFYSATSVLLNNGFTEEEVSRIFEIPYERLTVFQQWHIFIRCKRTKANGDNAYYCSSELLEQYNRIQRNRYKALKKICNNNFHKIKEQLKNMSLLERKRICCWIRDEVPKEKHGTYSLRGILAQIGISKSSYYEAINSKEYDRRALQLEEKRQKDIADLQKVLDYKGYSKGAQQVYMQMERITGRRMGINKIKRLMEQIGAYSSIRKASVSRKVQKEYYKKNIKSNLVKRRFRLNYPGQVVLTDVTYLKYAGKKIAYGSAAIDAVTGRIYRFNVSVFNDLNLVLETMRSLPQNKAKEQLKYILHSDQGSLYLVDEFQSLLQELGYLQSMSKRGNCWDNAPQESFFGHFKDECNYSKARSIEELNELIQQYVQYFNEERGQWNRNKMTPIEFETYIRNMDETEFAEWQKQEEAKYQLTKKKSIEKAIERAKTLGV